MKWTNEQLQAINDCGENIIVSAGAGSGKTAVLTQRVITKLKNGININNLLILTFTNAAAAEMKERIRNAIKKDPELTSQLDYIDSAYITTFDSFSMSVVKKYYYLLNISPNITVLDSSICNNVRSQLLDDIFEKLYEQREPNFIKLIDDLTIKDDSSIKKSILDVNTKLDRLINKNEYLESYISKYYCDKNINNLVNKYISDLLNKINKITSLLENMQYYCDGDFYSEYYQSFEKLINSKTYDEILNNINVKPPRLPRNSAEELKKIKEKIMTELKNIKKSLIYKSTLHIKETLQMTKSYSIAIINIIKELDKRLNQYKSSCDEYEFNDIAMMAINVVKNNKSALEELKNSFNEIMVDEYQDTSDIQETFINLISNNNVYMVGDVKQSIYRFRNANPDIFKNKYLNYSNHIGGKKIDLLNNFRSRSEVLDDINNIFNIIMDTNIGGANYKATHQMVFGNSVYTENHPDQNFNLEIYNYKRDDKKYSFGEYEAFIIANDIKNKINSGYLVIDKKTSKLRKVNYGDFCILIDRKSNFDLYKKIFEYLSIPLVIDYDEKITNEKDVLIIKNIIDLIIRIYNKIYDEKFKYDFYSIFRSYLFSNSDEVFAEYYINNNFKDSEIYKKCKNIAEKLDTLNNRTIIDEIIKEFDFYEKSILVGDIKKVIIRLDYLKTLGENLSLLGYDIFEFNTYLENMITSDSDITISMSASVPNNVKLMNIHKSKGLEFPICYFAGYSNKFNRQDINNLINFDKELGFILPFYDNGIGNTIIKELYKSKYNYEDISERIRLFYVALTRAKEKMIMVLNLSDEDILYNDSLKLEYNSFLSIMESIKDKLSDKIVNINEIKLTKDYNYNHTSSKKVDINNELIKVNEIFINNEIINEDHASKKINKLLTLEETKLLEYGTKIHELFEHTDFKNASNEQILSFLRHFDINNCKIYKEYEFITQIDGVEYHGIIDLLLEYDDYINIIDYKLKNINDDNYKNQLKIYKKYIESISNKKVNTYLYSIMDDILQEID